MGGAWVVAVLIDFRSSFQISDHHFRFQIIISDFRSSFPISIIISFFRILWYWLHFHWNTYIRLRQQRTEKLKATTLASAMETVEKFDYKLAIYSYPKFRSKFLEICVPPARCWSTRSTRMLGIGEFYVELSVKVVEVCLASRTWWYHSCFGSEGDTWTTGN